MRNLTILLSLIFITGCSSLQFKYATLNHAGYIDGIYNDDTVKVEVIESDFDLRRKFRFDNRFRWDYSMYAMNQSYMWHSDFFWRNRMFRNGFGFSSWDFYWNRFDFWWNFGSNNSFFYGYSAWDPFGFTWDPFGYDRWNWSNGYGWTDNRWRYRWNLYSWENRDDLRDVVRVKGRRGSRNIVNVNNDNSNRLNRRIKLNNGDGIIIQNSDGSIRRINNGRNNNNIRVYENPNNVPSNLKPNNNIRVRENNNNWNNRIVPRNNNNVNSRSSAPVRTYSPPPQTGTSGRTVISRGSRGNNIQQ